MMDDIDWYLNNTGGGPRRTNPALVSRILDTADVPDDLIDEIVHYCVARIVYPECEDTSHYFVSPRGHRGSATCQGGCGTELVLD